MNRTITMKWHLVSAVIATAVAGSLMACSDDEPDATSTGPATGSGGSGTGVGATAGATNELGGATAASTGGASSALSFSSSSDLGGAHSTVGGGGGSGTATNPSSTTSLSGAGGTRSSVGGSGGSAPTTDKIRTNLPSTATVIVKSTAAGTGLQLVSLNLLPDANSTLNYVQLLAEVKNNGSSLICFPNISIEFSDASGMVLWSDMAYADTSPYVDTLGVGSESCLKPGETGAIWANELAASPMSVASVAEVRITHDGLAQTDVRPFSYSLDAAIVQDDIYRDGNHWAMSGQFTPSEDVWNVMVTGYTRSSNGLISGRLTAVNLDSIAANSEWPFSTMTSIAGAKPSSLLTYVDFLLGVSSEGTSAGAMSPLLSNPVLDRTLFKRNELRRAAEERKALADAD